MTDTTSLCLQCQKGVTDQDSGLSCDMCGEWFHTKCVGVTKELYRGLMKMQETKGSQGGGIHWYCRHCIGVVGRMLKTMGGLQKQQENLEGVVSTLKTELAELTKVVVELKEMRREVDELKISEKRISRGLEDGLKKCEAEISALGIAVKGADDKISPKLSDAVEVEITKHAQEIIEIRTEMKKVDEKIDGTVRERVNENVLEEQERNARKANVICFGMEESSEEETMARIEHDTKYVQDILTSLHCEDSEIKQVIRLGKKPSKEEIQSGKKPRPLKVVLGTETSKNEVMNKARKLRSTQYQGIFIVQDMTQKERQLRKVLVEERDQRKANGEDVVIAQGKVVQRRKGGMN
jgi:hypothetical protein